VSKGLNLQQEILDIVMSVDIWLIQIGNIKMTHKRKIYFRRKGDGHIFECKVKGKTVLIWTLPKDKELFLRNLCKSSFFSEG